MIVPLKFRAGKRSLRWSGGGLLVLISIGMHGLLLGMPLPESTPETPSELPNRLTELNDPTAVVGVVRLPATPKPVAGAIRPAPPPVARAPQAPSQKPPQTQTATPAPAAPIAPETPAPPPPETVDLEPVPPEPPPATLDDRLRDPAQYEFNGQAKSLLNDEVSLYTNNLSTWLEQESQGLSEDDAPILGTKLAPLQVAYPIATCLVPPPSEGLVGVILSPSGQLLKDPVLLDSTGYTVLDEKALETALQRSFAPQDGPLPNPRASWLPVQVQYDAANCTP
ncbi:hypothetical protein [Nodosilinea nodulosa]|uniref:hypothetical protein n=1 Tax=Nodosilinea nodulosa TaxID=416001 RepID=UPI0012D82500|nr:hypothetical protein [Nodosilinea nodulosa]